MSAATRMLQQEQYENSIAEMKLVSEMFNKMANQCWKKCISRFNDPDLSVGEATCVDRCVEKYVQAQQKIGQRLQQAGAPK